MNFKFDELTAIYPEQLWIELSPEEQEKAWQLSANQPYSNAAARWTAFVNCLCLNTLIAYFQAESDFQENLIVWPNLNNLPSFWEVVNGTGLTLGKTRLVLIPSDKINISEFQIPQEWVDIPNWAAHYYLAVQLNLEECWLRVWGYANHQQIRNEGIYNQLDRTYSLDKEDLIEDLNVMWVGRELCPHREPEVKPLPSLLPLQAEKLLEQLSQQTAYSPRLNVPFEQWAALIASDERRRLYQLRQEKLQGNQTVEAVERNLSLANNLSLWFQNIFEAGWQSLDAMLSTEQSNLAFNFRSDSGLNRVGVKAAKLINLGMQLREQSVVLLVGLTPEIEQKVSIRVQLCPASGETYLPPNLRLGLLSYSGAVLQEVQSRSHDNYIQLNRFKFTPGKSFSIQVALDNVRIKEDFVLEPLDG